MRLIFEECKCVNRCSFKCFQSDVMTTERTRESQIKLRTNKIQENPLVMLQVGIYSLAELSLATQLDRYIQNGRRNLWGGLGVHSSTNQGPKVMNQHPAGLSNQPLLLGFHSGTQKVESIGRHDKMCCNSLFFSESTKTTSNNVNNNLEEDPMNSSYEAIYKLFV